MSEPIKLVTKPALVQDDIIERLDLMLERAKKGELAGMAIAYVVTDGGIGTHWSRSDQAGALMGAVALLQHRLCEEDE